MDAYAHPYRRDQFHGIEIEEFPAQIAQVALWLMDHQMNLRVGEEFGQYFARIPLVSQPAHRARQRAHAGLNEVLPAQLQLRVGNPPFVGAKFMATMTASAIDGPAPCSLALKMPGCWICGRLREGQHSPPRHRGVATQAGLMQCLRAQNHKPGTCHTRAAFVSTNSITQGEQVGVLWGWLLAQGVHIQFAHRTLCLSNEAWAGKPCTASSSALDCRTGSTR